MSRILKILVSVVLVACAASLLASPAASARGKQRGPKEQAPIVLAVGEIHMLDGRYIKAPKIQNPAIVKLIRNRRKNRWILRAKRRGVTYMTFKHTYSPQPKAKRRVKLKIVVR